MKIISANVNGLRSAAKKGFIDFLKSENPDIVCLQEIKVSQQNLPAELQNLSDYHLLLNSAQKNGYSGVAVYTKLKPLSINTSLGIQRFDYEGRLLQLEYPDFILLNLYLPHGGRQKENLEYKLYCYQKLIDRINNLSNKTIILIGDFNIAHQEIDLSRPKQNLQNIMFTTEERFQIDRILDQGFVDSFRYLNKQGGHYTWWPYAFQARTRNMGWRLDFAFIKSSIKIKSVNIYSQVNFSDHCPIGLEF